MKNFKYWTLVLAIAAGATAPLYGCSSDDVDTSGKKKNTDAGSDDDGDAGDEDGDGGEGGSGGEDGDGDGGNGGDGGSGGGPVTDATCTAMGAEACVTCCEGLYPDGAEVFNDAADACLCGASGLCKDECATTFCQGDKMVPADCYSCLNDDDNVETCGQQIGAACGPVPSCMNFYQNCYSKCPRQ